MLRPFHLAIPVDDLEQASVFYGDVLNCEQGRSDVHWIDWNLFGHQLVTHKVDMMPSAADCNQVDNKSVPVPHFGVLLEQATWQALIDRLIEKEIKFEIEPYIRFKGKAGEQGTFFIYDPARNALEFKYFRDLSSVFAV